VTGDALSNLERARGSTKSPNFAPELAPEANGSLLRRTAVHKRKPRRRSSPGLKVLLWGS